MKKKENIGSDISDEDLDMDLDDVAIKAVVRKAGGGGIKIIPKEFALALKRKFDKDFPDPKPNDAFAVPKEWLEKKLGLNTESVMGPKPYGTKKRLNRQHGDIVGEGKIWHVGSFEDENKVKFYLISIVDADTAEEDKWKKPKPKKDKEEEE